MTNLFEYLELQAQDEGREVRRATILANTRVRTRYQRFLTAATTGAEFDARFSTVEDDFYATIKEACAEERCPEIERVASVVIDNLRSAADVVDGDTYWQETQDLPAAGPKGVSDEASGQKFDPNAHGDYKGWTTPSLDVPSNVNPSEMQDIEDEADLYKDTEVPGLVKSVDADSPIGSGEAGDSTMTYPAGNQAAPVTSATYPDVPYAAPQKWSEPTQPDFDPNVPGSKPPMSEDEIDYQPTALDGTPENALSDAYHALLGQGKSPEEALQHINAFIDKLHSEKFNQQPDQHLDQEDLAGMHQQGEEDPDTDAPPSDEEERLSNVDIQGVAKAKARQHAASDSKWRVV